MTYRKQVVGFVLFLFCHLQAPSQEGLNRGVSRDPVKLAAYKVQEVSRKQGQLEIWRKQKKAEVVVIPNAMNYVFLSNEAEVISLITRFVDQLPR